MEIVQLMISDLTCDFMFSPVCIFLVSSTEPHTTTHESTHTYTVTNIVLPSAARQCFPTWIKRRSQRLFWFHFTKSSEGSLSAPRTADESVCLEGVLFFFLVFVLHLKWDHSRALCLPGSVADGETPSSSSSSQLLSWRLRSPHWLKTVKNLERRERKSGNPPFPFFSLSLWLVHIMTEEKPFKQCCAPWSTSQCISVITSTKCVLEQLCNHV